MHLLTANQAVEIVAIDYQNAPSQETNRWTSAPGVTYDIVVSPLKSALSAVETWSILTNNIPSQGAETSVVLPISDPGAWRAFRVRN